MKTTFTCVTFNSGLIVGRPGASMTYEKDKNNHRENLAYEAILILVVKEDFHNFNLLLIL